MSADASFLLVTSYILSNFLIELVGLSSVGKVANCHSLLDGSLRQGRPAWLLFDDLHCILHLHRIILKFVGAELFIIIFRFNTKIGELRRFFLKIGLRVIVSFYEANLSSLSHQYNISNQVEFYQLKVFEKE